MFLHIGADTTVSLKEVVAIFDIKETHVGRNHQVNSRFLEHVRQKNKIIDIADGNPKSFVITDHSVYLSAISSMTLKKRAEGFAEIDEEEEEEE